MAAATKQESFIGAVVGTSARSASRMRSLIAPVQHQIHSINCRSDKPAQFNSL